MPRRVSRSLAAGACSRSGVAGLVLSRRARGLPRSTAPADPGRAWPWLAAAYRGPPRVLDTGSGRPARRGSGNLGHVLSAGGTGRPRLGWGIGVPARSSTRFGIPPWWLFDRREPVGRASSKSTTRLGPGSWISAAAVLAWLAVATRHGAGGGGASTWPPAAACALVLCVAIGANDGGDPPRGRILGGTLAYTLWTALDRRDVRLAGGGCGRRSS